ncbi:dynein regulatory complex subunit 2, partial [Aphidius gifuensis]|uniref:dynein regulatory complex subunit 2 n=1 Tax=Aphidius gifuensis TaxID=684658 RepID=UPI001CDC3B24
MPAKKKKGKGSKLTRMNEEEKLRYLQHRAEIELEAKRRKQQLISIFTKNKLKREEAFSRLNTAKINEQWRFNLRQIKCKELDDEIKYLWSNFDRKIKLKNEQIDNLNVELINANLDHNKLQESHMKIIDKLILQHVEYLNKIHDDYKKSIINIQLNDLNEMIIIKNKLLSNTYSRNSMNTYYIQHTMEETIDNVNQQLGNKISKLWSLLIETITDYQKQTSLKKKQYDILKESDDKHKIETLQLKKYESQLELSIEKIKNKQIEFNETLFKICTNLAEPNLLATIKKYDL